MILRGLLQPKPSCWSYIRECDALTLARRYQATIAWWKAHMGLQRKAGWKQLLVTNPLPVLVLHPDHSEGNDMWKTVVAEKYITQTGKAKYLCWITSAFIRQDTEGQENFWKNKFIALLLSLVNTTKMRTGQVFIWIYGKINVSIYSYVYTQEHFEPEKSVPVSLWISWKT